MVFGFWGLRRCLGNLVGFLSVVCGGVRVWLLLRGRLLGFGMGRALLHCLRDCSSSLSKLLKLLKNLFGMLVCIELGGRFGQDWVLRSRALGDDMLQVASSFENRR